MEELTTFINTLGFPIVVCVYMAYQNEKQNGILDKFIARLESIDIRLQHLEGTKKD